MYNFISKYNQSLLGHCTKLSYKALIWIGLIAFLLHSAAYAGEITSLNKSLRLGVLPDSSKKIIDTRVGPLLRYIKRETGIAIELVVPKDYQELLNQFKEKSVDLAIFGGYTFIKAQQEAGAEPFVMRDIDLRFSTMFLVNPDNENKKLEDLKGKTISFGSRLSTSGHLMPRYFLTERKIDPETFFSKVLYSGNHDKTAYWVRDGKVDLGAANSDVIRKMFSDGHLKRDDIRILWETPVYSDYVWAVQSDLDKTIQTRLMDSFLALTPINSEHRKILNAIGAGGFLPANNADFASLRKIVSVFEQEMK